MINVLKFMKVQMMYILFSIYTWINKLKNISSILKWFFFFGSGWAEYGGDKVEFTHNRTEIERENTST